MRGGKCASWKSSKDRGLFSPHGDTAVFGLEGLLALFASDGDVVRRAKTKRGLYLYSSIQLTHRPRASGEHDAMLIVNL